MMINLDYLYSIGLSLLLSVLIGWERETQDKPAGFRDVVFITLGATLIVIFSLKYTNIMGTNFDAIRAIAYYLVAIGFVGGGLIYKGEKKLQGVTTSALLLPASIMGFFCGIGDYLLASVIGLILYLILKLRHVKIRIEKSGKKYRNKTNRKN